MARLGWLLLREGRRGRAGRVETVLGRELARYPTRPSALARRARFAPTPDTPFAIEPGSPAAFGHRLWTDATGTMPGAAVPRDAFCGHGVREPLLVVIPSLERVLVRAGSGPDLLPDFRRELVARITAALLA
ncbi:MAG: hypothetical protein NZ555_15980 [Geminicoccaceae bacterium]|nr:hypothetical protein [Geminicoccaceae bacterium]MCX8100862.1 hypothetical protein [Geminicoccaceae bacterium]MDW8370097.1 hypothetical protein [Geminicoccaceae bacterium]